MMYKHQKIYKKAYSVLDTHLIMYFFYEKRRGSLHRALWELLK
jgi:hypothetical protein